MSNPDTLNTRSQPGSLDLAAYSMPSIMGGRDAPGARAAAAITATLRFVAAEPFSAGLTARDTSPRGTFCGHFLRLRKSRYGGDLRCSVGRAEWDATTIVGGHEGRLCVPRTTTRSGAVEIEPAHPGTQGHGIARSAVLRRSDVVDALVELHRCGRGKCAFGRPHVTTSQRRCSNTSRHCSPCTTSSTRRYRSRLLIVCANAQAWVAAVRPALAKWLSASLSALIVSFVGSHWSKPVVGHRRRPLSSSLAMSEFERARVDPASMRIAQVALDLRVV